MANTELISKSIRERKPIINHELNSRLKELQKQMVKISFSNGLDSEQYKEIIKEAQALRQNIS